MSDYKRTVIAIEVAHEGELPTGINIAQVVEEYLTRTLSWETEDISQEFAVQLAIHMGSDEHYFDIEGGA